MAYPVGTFTKFGLSIATIGLLAFMPGPQARTIFHCADAKSHKAGFGVRGMKPMLHLIGDYGETYSIFINPESREWTVTRQLMLEQVSCVMANGKRFSSHPDLWSIGTDANEG